MPTSTPTAQFDRTMKMDIHDIVRELNSVLGTTLVASLAGSKDRKIPLRWAKPDGPEPRVDAQRRLIYAHRQFHEISASDGDHVARQWFVGSNPWLGEDSPITAIREDRHGAVTRAVRAFVDGSVDE
jgi:hypothetical protein